MNEVIYPYGAWWYGEGDWFYVMWFKSETEAKNFMDITMPDKYKVYRIEKEDDIRSKYFNLHMHGIPIFEYPVTEEWRRYVEQTTQMDLGGDTLYEERKITWTQSVNSWVRGCVHWFLSWLSFQWRQFFHSEYFFLGVYILITVVVVIMAAAMKANIK